MQASEVATAAGVLCAKDKMPVQSKRMMSAGTMTMPPPMPSRPPRKPLNRPTPRHRRVKKTGLNSSKVPTWRCLRPKRRRSPGAKVTHLITSSRDQEKQRLRFASVMKMPLRLHAVSALVLVIFASVVEARSIELDNGDVYEGDLVDGLRTGQGTYTWVDGRTYTGAFVADRRHGEGVLTWKNGNRYEGQFDGDRMHGQGVFTWSNGDRYEGTFARGRRSGSGRFDWASGEGYVGEFVNGELHGQGLFTWPNGNRYSGGFANDQRHGLGVFHWRDGTIFRGQYRANKMHGYGVKEQPDGTMELQQWTDEGLQMRMPLAEDERCRLRLQDRYWMFSSEGCVNGLAHGHGLATSLDGELIIADGHFVLGHLVAGEARPIWLRSRAQ
ncbi:MAG: hypothetical protein F4149_11610 [Gammaproteobacteria bacterium]|nr:hypothetical protein [Gammaproteobacteria bacterium]MYK82731.1 hypothetical protein [Gammaproteobacteria bacterium]